jgi:hypothetical protein
MVVPKSFLSKDFHLRAEPQSKVLFLPAITTR